MGKNEATVTFFRFACAGVNRSTRGQNVSVVTSAPLQLLPRGYFARVHQVGDLERHFGDVQIGAIARMMIVKSSSVKRWMTVRNPEVLPECHMRGRPL